MKPLIVGEALSQQGDGRPFSGPSGKRLAELSGCRTYEELAALFRLENLLPAHEAKAMYKRDGEITWDRKSMRRRARFWMDNYDEYLEPITICAGRKVARAFGFPKDTPFFLPQPRLCWTEPCHSAMSTGDHDDPECVHEPVPVVFFVMPHPSGLSHGWNIPSNVEVARIFLAMMSMASDQSTSER